MELSDGSRICADCGAIFVIDDGERKYFEAHDLTLPKRCKDCRALRAEVRHREDVQRAIASCGRPSRIKPPSSMPPKCSAYPDHVGGFRLGNYRNFGSLLRFSFAHCSNSRSNHRELTRREMSAASG